MRNERDLVVPQEVKEDSKSVEVLRAWVANEGLVCALRPTIWDDPGAWGMVLADAARHVADAFEQEHGVKAALSLRKIREVFEHELSGRADGISGEFEK